MESGTVGSLNIEYLLTRAFDFLSGFQGTVTGAPEGFVHFLTGVMVVGMFLSLVFLILIVYAQIKLLQVEHAGFHAMEVHEHAHHEAEVESTGVNDRWERIVTLATSPSHGEWRRAILEADIMLGDELNKAGYSGATIGDQLKMANPIQLTTLDLAWKAHKVRNEVAHGGESFVLTERDLRATIDYYKRVFEELGAI